MQWLHPGSNGDIPVNQIRPDLIKQISARIQSGLFLAASPCRNKYEIISDSKDNIHFRSASFLTSIYVGLNNVKISIDKNNNKIHYDFTYWPWAWYCIVLSFSLTLIIGFLFLSHLFRIYLFPEIEYPSSFEISLYIIPSLVFWGLIWPWILIYRHKKSASKALEMIIHQVNLTDQKGAAAQFDKYLNRNKYLAFSFWRGKVVWGLVIILTLLIGKLLHRRWWLGPAHFGYSVPGIQPDQKLPVRQDSHSGVDLTTTTEYDFPGFLGKNREGAVDNIKLNPDWEKFPPKLLWRQPIGGGWSAFSIVNGFAVTMEQRGPEEQVSCYSLDSGKHHWTVFWNERFFLFGDGPRSTPAISGGKVFALGALGHLTCIDGNSGKVIWERELLKDLGLHWSEENREVSFGRSNSPLVVGNTVVVPGGGKAGKYVSLLAYDVETGEIRWKGGDQQISYSSPVLADLLGDKQILIVNEKTVSGHNPETGLELWSYPWPSSSKKDANVSQPVPLGGDRILLTKGYQMGAAVIQLSGSHKGEPIKVNRVWRNPDVLKTKFTNVAVFGNFAYGLSDTRLECVDLRTGIRCWKKGRYGYGQLLRVGNLLLVQGEYGKLSLVSLDPQTPNKVLGSIQALKGKTWNNIALYKNYLLVRNATETACYELPILSE